MELIPDLGRVELLSTYEATSNKDECKVGE